MTTLSFDIGGMTCGGCTGSVQRMLSKIDGVSQADVTLHPGVATMLTDSERVTSAQIEAAITGLGYEAKARPAPQSRQAPQ